MTTNRRNFLLASAAAAGGIALLKTIDDTLAGDAPVATFKPLKIRGIHPHLCCYNTPLGTLPAKDHGECGIGAVVEWADKLWAITYPPHKRSGSRDKLYEIDQNFVQTIREESVGGTHASRMIHRASQQLIIGPYFINEKGVVRACDLKQLDGRMTAVAEHLTDPDNWVYFYDMEGTLYEVNVHDLSVKKLFDKPVPGWHGKGAYTGQGRLVVSNNGEHASGERSYKTLQAGGPPKHKDEAGVLAEWDGKTWTIIERKQFTDITGPGGIEGSPAPDAPLWALGWDRRSVILKVLEDGQWSTRRLLKASHCFDASHGWFTEWPRIREVAPGMAFVVMHGGVFMLPLSFKETTPAGLQPVCSHLRYIPDFCTFDGQLVLAADDASFMQNPLVGQAQSNFWMGKSQDLIHWGPKFGAGGVWQHDDVTEAPSDPLLVRGYDHRTVHLVNHGDAPVRVELLADVASNNGYNSIGSIELLPGYQSVILDKSVEAQWLKVQSHLAAKLTAYVHGYSPRAREAEEEKLFDGLATVENPQNYLAATFRPGGHNRSLEVLAYAVDADGKAGPLMHREVELADDLTKLEVNAGPTDRLAFLEKTLAVEQPFEMVDETVVVTDFAKKRWRLPVASKIYSEPFAAGWARGVREVVSERFMANLHGTIYEMPRTDDHQPMFSHIKPVASHNKLITDMCTWRGLMVLAGASLAADADSSNLQLASEKLPLWMGAIDDLWKLGRPVGQGYLWRDTQVKVGDISDPILATGYEQIELSFWTDNDQGASIEIDVDFDHTGFHAYRVPVRIGGEVKPDVVPADQPRKSALQLSTPGGEVVAYSFPKGFQAHWIRVRAMHDGVMTVVVNYR